MTDWRVSFQFMTRQWRRLTKRERTLVALTGAVILSTLLYQLPYAAGEQKIRILRAKAEGTEKAVLDLTAGVTEIKGRAAEIRTGMATVPGKELFSDKSVVFLLEEFTVEARRMGVNILSVHPSREIDRERFREVSMNMDLKGRYRQMGEYFKRLENLARIVNIRNVRMEACPGTSSVCAVRVEAVAYMAK